MVVSAILENESSTKDDSSPHYSNALLLDADCF